MRLDLSLALDANEPVGADSLFLWTPGQESNLVAWWDAAHVVLTAGRVSQLTDRGALGNHLTQGTGALRPTVNAAALDNQDTLTFNESFLQGTFTLGTSWTIFMVYKSVTVPAGPGANDIIFDGKNSASGLLASDNTNKSYLFISSLVGSATVVANGAWKRVATVFAGASSALLENEVSRATGNPGSATAGGFSLGGLATGARRARFDFAEAVLVSGNASATTRANVAAYYKWKYPSIT